METVGIGQAEIDITRVADTSIVVLTPGMGDEIQVMKAGILEAADIFVINKADRNGATGLKAELELMLEMKSNSPDGWRPNVVLTEAIYDKGTGELAGEIFRHREFLISSGELEARRKQRARQELIEAIESSVKNYIDAEIDKDYLEELIDNIVQRKTNPHSAASKIINQSIKW